MPNLNKADAHSSCELGGGMPCIVRSGDAGDQWKYVRVIRGILNVGKGEKRFTGKN